MKYSIQHCLLLGLSLTAAAACGTDSIGPAADYTLSLTPASLTLVQGASASATINIGRSNFDGAVTLALANAPAGIVASFDPAASTGATASLTLDVGPGVAPGDYPLTVNGSATAGNRSTALALTVNSKPSAGSSVQVIAGTGYSCALKASGQAYCWGSNGGGQLGDGTTTERLVPTPVAGGFTFATLSAGGITCGVTVSSDGYCWGAGGRIGDGTTTNRPVPTPVAGGLKFASISAGVVHTCGVTTSGAAYCWGVAGGLGDGTSTDRMVPTPVVGGLTFKQISAGFYYTCGVTTAGDAYCWGGNAYFNYTSSPIPIDLSKKFASVSAGWTHTCGLATNGTVYCWGNNDVGELGDGTRMSRQNLLPVAGGLSFTSVSTGMDVYACGVTNNGSAYCWGLNAYGQLGDGTTANKLVPTLVSGDLTFVSVAASATPDGAHTCGLTTSGSVYCWGLNDHGQLGDGTLLTTRLVPTLVQFP
jgi:alpha-tubulin suppressor-like RCC1 family protein